MNLPNKLSLIRILLIPVIMIVYSIEPLRNQMVFEGAYHLSVCNLIIMILAIAGALTDLFDGKYARKHNLVTDLGKFLDPLADKLLVLTLLIIIYDQCNYYGALYYLDTGGKELEQLLRWWMVLIILAREFMVTGIRLVAAGKKQVIAASWYGKVKTTLQFVTLIILLAGCAVLENPNNGDLVPYEPIYVIFVNILIIATLTVTILSGYDYIVKNLDNLKDNTYKKKNKSQK
ncbi:MAG: CDP-alcohol phosphatidyltransferase family protein [Erysipelotrichaceae bacterium]|nr:CDP-alcohol phosphatidyltransferase family protein [Erysipelotrichaceae bacterium]